MKRLSVLYLLDSFPTDRLTIRQPLPEARLADSIRRLRDEDLERRRRARAERGVRLVRGDTSGSVWRSRADRIRLDIAIALSARSSDRRGVLSKAERATVRQLVARARSAHGEQSSDGRGLQANDVREPHDSGVFACAAGRAYVGLWFARAAENEHACATNALQLAIELDSHGGPHDLVERALRSARDERRHARQMAELARKFGSTPRWPDAPVTSPRTLVEMAVSNAIDACIGKTVAAHRAEVQATTTTDPDVARIMSLVARDERRRAELSWEIAAWIETRLDPEDLARVRSAMRSAALDASLALGVAPELADAIGQPPPETLAVLDTTLRAVLLERIDALREAIVDAA